MKNDKLSDIQGVEPTYKKGGNTMKTKMKKLMKNQKGMTLIELLAVIVIIAIIALIAIPAIGNIINNSKDKAILSDASNIISGAKIALEDNACGAEDATTHAITCTSDNLSKYVDNVKDNTFTVTKTNNTLTVNYAKFGNIKSNKFKYIGTHDISSDHQATETEVNKLLNGEGKDNLDTVSNPG